ncbi:YgaP family membrane protein [Sulfitobacter donghicola]|uniref:Inner membrane protein YgaP-like transmembrane domain-containing protein n=1 Tax=Sulfitobacter donghicola DSW-25 = KCTC 12864 = JCM 14565 TaxID=1300350 RepID=A0A073IGA3_9RHOB|nr:DUF2892 domain-containing protein [Sulfitobacter donghicola]KEJ88545.1 hypothetical protein DSW25_15790 [Sulfitobacter donghicola DSW-25 = KCTC 12864 = JCM 14565]KIN69570.1 DUF2892 domain containing protein [Sulfitobacter donghicola DSW-25 = KCTC 12864 = JCM 14565]
MLTANLGNMDRLIRAGLGLVAFFAPLLNVPPIWSSGFFAYLSMIVGLVLIATATIRFCPLYRIIGISTCSFK